MRHWNREGPPAYIAVAAYLGLRRQAGSAGQDLAGEDLLNFLTVFPGGANMSPG
ncbi:MAG TPA: hypothetical protein VN694_14410 [Caulobacteraceae bacterium]|nr:hypothetical protein [Caulobacteraceae bacterium]